MKKTNAARLLDKHKIKYELVEYTFDENNLSATKVAAELGQNIEQVFKTLVLRGDKSGVFVAIVPGNAELNIKKAAKLSENKKAEMILMKELLPLTGYIRGGCTAIAMKKNYPTFIHESCLNFDFIFVSAGVRGTQIKIAPKDLIDFVKIRIGDLIDQ
ncbi:MAG: Cys-tRNA(Pro) deacylase [Prolixibacteraceae bacterium]|nr:Cys-tRNA(Pro) deacylase [Prolixibacteraceae bacterium]